MKCTVWLVQWQPEASRVHPITRRARPSSAIIPAGMESIVHLKGTSVCLSFLSSIRMRLIHLSDWFTDDETPRKNSRVAGRFSHESLLIRVMNIRSFDLIWQNIDLSYARVLAFDIFNITNVETVNCRVYPPTPTFARPYLPSYNRSYGGGGAEHVGGHVGGRSQSPQVWQMTSSHQQVHHYWDDRCKVRTVVNCNVSWLSWDWCEFNERLWCAGSWLHDFWDVELPIGKGSGGSGEAWCGVPSAAGLAATETPVASCQ